MLDNDREEIAAEVRAALARACKTQREFAAALGLDQASTWLRLRGRRSFRGEELAATARWLGIPVESLIPMREKQVA